MTTKVGSGDFATTRWSLVIGAGDENPSTANASLKILCQHYWYPVYAYLRRSGHAPEAANELTRAFFSGLLRDGLRHREAMRHGRFRLFLLDELHWFLSVDRTDAPPVDPDESPAMAELEARHLTDSRAHGSPEEMLRRGFALEVMGAAHQRLRQEAAESGHVAMFEALAGFLGTEPLAGEYDAIAQRLGVRPLFVSMAVKRLRQRFRELVDHELAETLADPTEMAAERDALLQVSGDPSA